MSDSRENELIECVMRGDTVALQQLLLLRYDWLLAYVTREISRGDIRGVSAEDIVQNACFKIFRAAQTFRPRYPAAIFAWFKTITRNQLIDDLRQRPLEPPESRYELEPATESVRRLLDDLAESSDPRASVIARHGEMHRAFHQILKNMHVDFRQVIELLYLEERTVDEAAEIMGRTPGSVRGLRRRARAKLREEFVTLSRFI